MSVRLGRVWDFKGSASTLVYDCRAKGVKSVVKLAAVAYRGFLK